MAQDETQKKAKEKKKEERRKKFETLKNDKSIPPYVPSFNVCIYGDRISYGLFDKEHGGWVVQLKLYLQKRTPRAIVYNLTIPTDTTREILQRFDSEIEPRNPNAFIFALGLNDASPLPGNDKPQIPLDEFQKNLSEILFKAKQKTKQILMLGPMPVNEYLTNPVPWDHKLFYKNIHIDAYNETMAKICALEKVAFVNIYDEVKLRDHRSLLEDGLHLNAEGHQYIFNKIKSAIKI